MVAQPLVFTSGVAGVVAVPGTTETVIATLSGVVTKYSGQTIKLTGTAVFTQGADSDGVIFRIRRASLTGTLVSDAGTQAITGGPGATFTYGVFAEDAPGDVTGFVY